MLTLHTVRLGLSNVVEIFQSCLRSQEILRIKEYSQVTSICQELLSKS